MADNVTVNYGTPVEALVASELLGGGPAQCQRVKLVTGDLHTDGGDVGPANPLAFSQVAPAFTVYQWNVPAPGSSAPVGPPTSLRWGAYLFSPTSNGSDLILLGDQVSVDGSGGLPLEPGRGLYLPIPDPSVLYMAAPVGTPVLCVFVA